MFTMRSLECDNRMQVQECILYISVPCVYIIVNLGLHDISK